MSVATQQSTTRLITPIPLSMNCVDTPHENGLSYHSIYVFCDNYVSGSFVYYDAEYSRVMMHDYRNLMNTLRGQFGWTSEKNWFYMSTMLTYNNQNLYAMGFHFTREEDAIAFKLAYI